MSKKLVYLTPPEDSFEAAYLEVREKEERLYPDDIVKRLPILPQDHPQAEEWALRQRNIELLKAHVAQRQAQDVLDLGCGNGWLTHQLVEENSSRKVLGLDINAAELEQANRLFSSDQCTFAYGDIFQAELTPQSFDIITLVSCAQYFPSLPILLNRLQQLLQAEGEIHILDTPFYDSAELAAARKRTDDYYAQQGVSLMSNHYHHRSWAELKGYRYEIKYNPRTLGSRIQRKLGLKRSPFPWLIIHRS